MLDNETATLPEQGSEIETPAQATQPGVETPVEPQQTGNDQVETVEQQPQAKEPQRGKASDFYRERKRVRELEDAVRELTEWKRQAAESLTQKFNKPESPAKPKYSPDDFYSKGHEIVSELESKYEQKIRELEEKIMTREQTEQTAKMESSKQEALELLFPKAGEADESDWRERADRDKDRANKIWAIVKKYDLAEQADRKPKETAALILSLLNTSSPNPTVLPKKLMGGSAKGTPPSTGKSSKELKYAELKKLSQEASDNPSLRNDAKHKDRRMQLISELERLEEERK
jgi:hypothetical protein